MTETTLSRRTFMISTGASGVAITTGTTSGRAERGDLPSDAPMVYEVQRTEEEWRERLSAEEYFILRDGGTEWPKTDPKWNDYREGTFSCRGCGLDVYSSDWRVPLEIGWIFFAHNIPATVLMGIDGPEEKYGQAMGESRNNIETHCRRCGSHFGHLLMIDNTHLVHCINGASLTFREKTA